MSSPASACASSPSCRSASRRSSRLDDLDRLVGVVTRLRAAVDGLESAEYVVRRGVDLVMERFGVADPFARPYPVYVLVEAAGRLDQSDALGAAIGDRPESSTPRSRRPAPGARSCGGSANCTPTRWPRSARRGSTTSPSRSTAVPGFVTAADAAIAENAPGLLLHHFGHLGDGNVHLNVLGTNAMGADQLHSLDGAVFAVVGEAGGSVSAEHGIGRLKRPWLHLSRSAAELTAFRAVKRALDPTGMLNPGVLLPDP